MIQKTYHSGALVIYTVLTALANTLIVYVLSFHINVSDLTTFSIHCYPK